MTCTTSQKLTTPQKLYSDSAEDSADTMAKSMTWRTVEASQKTAGDMLPQSQVGLLWMCLFTRHNNSSTDDKTFMVWDLYPALIDPRNRESVASDISEEFQPLQRAQPTSYVINFPHPLTTVCSHPTTSREFVVADSRGSIFLTDWRSDPDENEQVSWRNSSVIELIEPRALADSISGNGSRWGGSVAWRRDSFDM